MVNPRVNPLGSRAQGMQLSLLANQSQPHGCASFRLKQLQGSYPNRPAGRQTDAQARKHADKPSPGQEASEKTGRASRQDSTQAGNRRADEQNNKQTNRKVPPKKQETLPTAARVSTDPGPKAARVCRPRGLPHNPTYRKVPPKKSVAVPKAAPASADPGIYLTNHHTKNSHPKRKDSIQASTATKRQPEYPQTPQSASEADIPESQKKAKERCPKRKHQPKHPQTPKGQ